MLEAASSQQRPHHDHSRPELSSPPYSTTQKTFTMADSNTTAPITPAAVRPNRPMSEALLNEKVRLGLGYKKENGGA